MEEDYSDENSVDDEPFQERQIVKESDDDDDFAFLVKSCFFKT